MRKVPNPFARLDGFKCFGCSSSNMSGLQLEFYEDGKHFQASWMPTREFEGYLYTLHGGIQATLVDEVAGWLVCMRFQTMAYTVKLSLKYKKVIKVTHGPITARVHVHTVRDRLVVVHGEILNYAGEVASEAELHFLTLPDEEAQEALGYNFKAFFAPGELESFKYEAHENNNAC